MAKPKKRGMCHICGDIGDLSYEHVPPKSAFNDAPVRVLRGEDAISADPDNLPSGRLQNRGAGEYTLCELCNKRTGGWYGRAFASFAWQAARILQATKGEASLYYGYQIYPLRVLKQVACMFMSANGPQFAAVNPDLVRFVLSKYAVGLDPKYRFLAYYNAGERSRLIGVSGILNIGSREIRVLTEVTFPPLGFLLCLSGPVPDRRLVDITGFSRALYDDFRAVNLRVPVLPVFSHFPADFRDRETVIRETEENRLAALRDG